MIGEVAVGFFISFIVAYLNTLLFGLIIDDTFGYSTRTSRIIVFCATLIIGFGLSIACAILSA